MSSTTNARIGPQTLMERIQDIMMNLNTLRAEEATIMSTLYEPVPTPAPAATTATTGSEQIQNSTPTSGSGSGTGSEDPTPKKYIIRGLEQERSKLLVVCVKIHKNSYELNMRLAHLPDRLPDYKRQCGVKLAMDLTALQRDMFEEEAAMAETLEAKTISPHNRFILYHHREVIMAIDKTIELVCQMVLTFGIQLPPELAEAARAAGLP